METREAILIVGAAVAIAATAAMIAYLLATRLWWFVQRNVPEESGPLWIPTSKGVLPDSRTVPFHRKDETSACSDHGVCFGQYFDAVDAEGADVELGDDEGAWSCELCGEWVPESKVDFWYDLPPAPGTEPRQEGD
jgi:hypothetical protein